MLIEFIGSTGAGKSTVLRRVERRLSNCTSTMTSDRLVTGLLGLGGVVNPTVQNLIQEAVGFPFFLFSLPQQRAFVGCTLKLLLRGARPSMTLINNLRSLERKLGVYTLTKRMAGDRIILVDEGPVLATHFLVPAMSELADCEIAEFAKTLPLPNLIVYVRAPVATIVSRTLRRPDPPREVASLIQKDLTRYAEATVALFELLVTLLRDKVPILVVDNPDMDDQHQKTIVETIENFILNHKRQLCGSSIPESTGSACSRLGQRRASAP